jgi:mono/diheme cytochrome c family protein
MKAIKALFIAAPVLLAAALVARCLAADAPVTATTGIHTIDLPRLEPQLPPGAGSQTVATACIICHSNRYITMQPALSKTAWTNLVDKMRKTFGAPLNDQQAVEAVNYLFSIRGNGQP